MRDKRVFVLGLVLLLAVAAGLAIYNRASEPGCGQAGCFDTLRITFRGEPLPSYTAVIEQAEMREIILYCPDLARSNQGELNQTHDAGGLPADVESGLIAAVERCGTGGGAVNAWRTLDGTLVEGQIWCGLESIPPGLVFMGCRADGMLLQVTPDSLRLRVEWPGGSRVEELAPVYDLYYPNGEACGGACQIAEMIVEIP